MMVGWQEPDKNADHNENLLALVVAKRGSSWYNSSYGASESSESSANFANLTGIEFYLKTY